MSLSLLIWIISDMIGYLAIDIIRSAFCMTKATWFTNLVKTCSMTYDFLKFLFVVLFFVAFVMTIWSVRSLINRRLSMSMTSVIRFCVSFESRFNWWCSNLHRDISMCQTGDCSVYLLDDVCPSRLDPVVLQYRQSVWVSKGIDEFHRVSSSVHRVSSSVKILLEYNVAGIETEVLS